MTSARLWGLTMACALGGAACGNATRAENVDAGAPSTDAGAAGPPGAQACDPLATFGALVQVVIPGVNGLLTRSPNLSPDELTMYFDAEAAGGDTNLYVTTRAARTDDWSPATALTSVNSSSNDDRVSVSSDGLTLWFVSNRIASQPDHVFVATRASTLAAFGTPAVASINASDTSVSDFSPFETADNQELWFSSSRTPTQGC